MLVACAIATTNICNANKITKRNNKSPTRRKKQESEQYGRTFFPYKIRPKKSHTSSVFDNA